MLLLWGRDLQNNHDQQLTGDCFQEESKDSKNPLQIALDSIIRLFRKGDDAKYPASEPASGYSQTPTKPKSGKDW